MKDTATPRKSWWRGPRLAACMLGAGTLAAVLVTYMLAHAEERTDSAGAARSVDTAMATSVDLSSNQLQMLSISTVSTRSFPVQFQAVGDIDFNEDMETEVFPPYQGRIVDLYVKLGDKVHKGQTLFTLQSPDLIQADSALIAAAATLQLTTRALQRATQLRQVEGIADKDYEQAVSDQQSAEGAFKAARDAVIVFGKSSEEIDRMLSTRTVDPYLVVHSPVAGSVTARNAAPGVFVQPGSTPAPYTVADVSRVWLNASVTESDMPHVHAGQAVQASVMAYPQRLFSGRISTVGASVDPQLHRGLVRAEIDDPHHELFPGMFASFVILSGVSMTSPAVPLDAVIREGDGTMTVWVTTDHHHFVQRTVEIGMQNEGYDQVLRGVRNGDQVVSRGAILLDNMVNAGET